MADSARLHGPPSRVHNRALIILRKEVLQIARNKILMGVEVAIGVTGVQGDTRIWDFGAQIGAILDLQDIVVLAAIMTR